MERKLIGVAASEDKAFAGKQAAVGIKRKVLGHSLSATLVVVDAERIARYGYVFALAVGSAGALGKTPRHPGPQHIGLTVHHAHHQVTNIRIGLHRRDSPAQIVVGMFDDAPRHWSEPMLAPPSGRGSARQQPLQLLQLHLTYASAPRAHTCGLVQEIRAD